MAGLREQAEADLATLLEDKTTGFGWDVVLTGPDGTATAMVGQSGDIAAVVDPETGVPVIGRNAHVTLRMSSLPAGPQPYGVADASAKPWRVTFNSIGGVSCDFKVVESKPDHTIGVLVLRLEAYTP